jgi:hypothetical protein
MHASIYVLHRLYVLCTFCALHSLLKTLYAIRRDLEILDLIFPVIDINQVLCNVRDNLFLYCRQRGRPPQM